MVQKLVEVSHSGLPNKAPVALLVKYAREAAEITQEKTTPWGDCSISWTLGNTGQKATLTSHHHRTTKNTQGPEEDFLRPVWWYSHLSFSLQCRHPIRVTILVLEGPLSIQLWL